MNNSLYFIKPLDQIFVREPVEQIFYLHIRNFSNWYSKLIQNFLESEELTQCE